MRRLMFMSILIGLLAACKPINADTPIPTPTIEPVAETDEPIPTPTVEKTLSATDTPSIFGEARYLGSPGIQASALSADNNYLAVANIEGVWLYCLNPQQLLWFKPIGKTVDLKWRDNESFMSITGDQVITWDALTGNQISELKLPFAIEHGLNASFSPDGTMLAAIDRSVFIFDLSTRDQLHKLETSYGSLEWSPDSKLLVAGAFWDANTGLMVGVPASFPEEYRDIFILSSDGAFSPNGTLYVSGHYFPGGDHDMLHQGGGFIKISNVSTGEFVNLFGTEDGVWDVVFSPDGQEIGYNLYGYALITFRSVASGEITRVIDNSGRLEYSQDDSLLIVTSADAVTLYDAQTFEQKHLIGGYTNRAHEIEFSPDGSMIASTSSSRVNIWDVQTGQWLRSLAQATIETDLTWSPTAPLIAVGLANPVIWNAETGEQVATLDAGYERMYPRSLVAFSPDGKLLAATSGDFEGYDFYEGDLYFGPGSMTFYGDGDRVILWDMETLTPVKDLFLEAAVAAMTWSPDGSTLAIYVRFFPYHGDGYRLQIWEVASGNIINSFSPGLAPEAYSRKVMVWQPNAPVIAGVDQLFTGSVLSLWNTNTGEKIRSMIGGKAPYGGRAFSPDGRYLAGTSSDSIFIWEVSTGTLIDSLVVEQSEHYFYDYLSDVAFSPDGNTLAVAAQSAIIVIPLHWDRLP